MHYDQQRIRQCDQLGVDRPGSLPVSGMGITAQECAEFCRRQPGCVAAQTSESGRCVTFKTCDGVAKSEAVWFTYRRACEGPAPEPVAATTTTTTTTTTGTTTTTATTTTT